MKNIEFYISRVNQNLRYKNERDIEIGVFLSFVKSCSSEIETFLDVGAHASADSYLPDLMNLFRDETIYDALDIYHDPKVEQEVNKFYTGDVTKLKLPQYDLVSCISSIEHSGITTYKVSDFHQERVKVFERLCSLTKKYLYVTFPFGQEGLSPGQYANVTEADLVKFQKSACAYGLQPSYIKFFFNLFPQGSHPWNFVPRNEASNIPLDTSKGVQCLCTCFFEK